jgi:hypothetical protein
MISDQLAFWLPEYLTQLCDSLCYVLVMHQAAVLDGFARD